jgi:hypothetical protein
VNTKAHARFSASGSAKWFLCAGSIEAESGLPNKSSIYADEGTAAHELAEICLTMGERASEWVNKQLIDNNAVTVTQEMADYVQVYVDYVKSKNGMVLVEQYVDFSHVAPDGFGTCDALVMGNDTLHVIDLKYGKGVRVDAENNTQALLYAIGAISNHSWMAFKTIVITIVQPRLDHISEWELTIDEVNAWAERLTQAAERAAQPNAPRTPGEKQCQWCKAKPTCPALKVYAEQAMMSQFDDLSPANPDTLTDQQLRKALESKKLIVSWLDAVESLVSERLESGKSFEGFKMVEGRSNRAWIDDDRAASALSDLLGLDAFEHKLLSVAKAEKAVGKGNKEIIDSLSTKPQGTPTLVPESDKRPSCIVSAKDFEIII